MGIIGMTTEQWDAMESKTGGFSLCPAGSGLLLEITGHREGTYKDKKTGLDVEYITLACSHTDEEGVKHDHWEFFNLLEADMPYLKGFLEKIERMDLFKLGEDAEWEMLNGTVITADIKHRVKKGTEEKQSVLIRNTITAVSHEDGVEVADWREEMGLEPKEEEEKPAKKFKKPAKKATASAKRTGKKVEPEEEEEEEEEPEEDEEEEDDTAPKRSKRRSRRGERED